MFENFRERLHMVQQDFTAGFRTLGSREGKMKVKLRSRTEDGPSGFTGGLDVLHRFEDGWFLLHRRTTDCGQAAETVYGDVVMLSALWEKNRSSLGQLQEQLQTLPAFLSELDAVTTSIAHLEGEFEELESRLLYLETLCSQCDQQAVKLQHRHLLDGYKKKKRKELQSLQAELHLEHQQQLSQLEQAQQHQLRERQRAFEQAFRQDVDQYLSTGGLQATGSLQARESTAAAVCALDQMTITNLSDQEALDDFLNSSEEDLSAGSSLTSGPDPGSNSSESLSPAPPTVSQRLQEEAAWRPQEDRGSEDGDELVVQSDQEDVEADGLQDITTVQLSDDSDSA